MIFFLCQMQPLMPKATAIWLVENTALTFEQIATFCGLHVLEIEAIANGEMGTNMAGLDPVISSQLTHEEIARCEADPNAVLQLKAVHNFNDAKRTGKYTPVSKRQTKPNAIAWLVKYYPEIEESDICSLLGTTKATIRAIKNKTHKRYDELVPKSPVVLELCSEKDLDFIIAKTKREREK